MVRRFVAVGVAVVGAATFGACETPSSKIQAPDGSAGTSGIVQQCFGDPDASDRDAAGNVSLGCARAAALDGTCSSQDLAGTGYASSGWNEAYECDCLDGNCEANGGPCIRENSFCPECIASSPRELGLGCFPLAVATGFGLGSGRATFCCSPNHGDRCVRDPAYDYGTDRTFCQKSDQPYFFHCLEDGQGGPFASCTAVVGSSGSEGFCCSTSG